MDSKPVIAVKDLTKIYRQNKWFGKSSEFTAVNTISFNLYKGEILGILGPNGAGKTTTIQMLLGLLTPTSGTITYFGKNLYTDREDIMRKIAFVSPYLKLPGSLTIEESIKVYAYLYEISEHRNTILEEKLKLFDLWDIKDRLVRNLSAGQLTRLMLAKAFIAQPDIVLLDEPTAALDPDVAVRIRDYILQEKRKRHMAVIITSHNMAEVEEMCDRVLIFKSGTIIADEVPQKLAVQVTTSRLKLLVPDIQKAIEFAQQHQDIYEVEGHFIEFKTDEKKIPALLQDIMHAGIHYTEISIAKPTLEDYFLSITNHR